MKRYGSLSTMALVILSVHFARPTSRNAFALTSVAVQSVESQPLYRFRSKKGYLLYTTRSEVPKFSNGPWVNDGIVCHVPTAPNHTINTKPVYQLSKSDNWGVRFAYTSSFAEADGYKGGPANENGVGQWMNQGQVFRVASDQALKTVPLYRLYLPVKLTNPGQQFTGVVPGTDAQLLTASENEKNNAVSQGWVSQGIIGYVWLTPYPALPGPLPDLTVFSTKADESSVTVVVTNKGKANTGGVKFHARLSVFDQNGKLVFETTQPAPGLSPNQGEQIVFAVKGMNLYNKRYQVTLDSSNVLKESDENNNKSEIAEGPRKNLISPKVDPNAVRPPSIVIAERKDEKAKDGSDRTTFKLEVTNWDQYPVEWFKDLTVLPPAICDGKQTHAQMLLHVFGEVGGKQYKGGCKPLLAPLHLKTVQTIAFGGQFPIPDKIFVVLEDRLVGARYTSSSAVVGALGVDDALFPLGCKRFLGRATDFVCSKKIGFDACENLRKQGKPIICRAIGDAAKK